MQQKIITFDVGGTNISGGVVEIDTFDFSYNFLDYFEEENPKEPEKIKKIFLEKCLEFRESFEADKVAISTSKIPDNKDKKIIQAELIYGIDEFGFDFLLEEGFQAELENDGRCFTLGEYYFNKGKDADGLLTLAIGTRIGGGFIDGNGRLIKGANSSALEVSHMKIKTDSNWKEWEELAGGLAIERIYKEKAGEEITSHEVFQKKEAGEPVAQEVIAIVEDYLGVGVASLVNVFDPEVIVFGGGLSGQKEFIKNAIKVAKQHLFNKNAGYRFEISELDRKANQLGAASLFID